ncbi:hypothetical protein M2302_002254 [Micromonospora sp. A200]|uniref:hypothetical protein n=1 Tax=Micromonospora sp. A200 TaxID=2940568 RepID=UPI0024744D63|nr:hypothetical protein [Micromonospora sp. A200]MDH6462079.1 hypothetical protein [Micromonospora sp. A200]
MTVGTPTRLFAGYGDYCSQPAQWTVDHVTDGNPARDYYLVTVTSETLHTRSSQVFGSTHDVKVAAAWLVGHGVSPRCCDYCDNPAAYRSLDATDEVLCRACLWEQAIGRPSDSARPLTDPQRVRLMVAELTRR